MLFNSPEFLFCFLPITLFAFALVRRAEHKALAHGVLLCASLFFYAWWDVAYLPLLLLSIAGNFALAKLMWWKPVARPWCLAAGVALNIGLLAHYKYSAFLLSDVLGFPGVVSDTGLTGLPLGISFFSFQQLAWLFDAARANAERTSLPVYAVFVSFFPQLIAGPIVHHKELVPQLTSPQLGCVPASTFAAGFSLFTLGLFKKVVIADFFAPTADVAFRMCSEQQLIQCHQAWTGLASYMCQIYFDFSGYSDMALGLGLLFGIALPINFASPYKATDMADFWRRWHITLSQFLRDFVYIPLGGNRAGLPRQMINVVCTMAVGGLWHGAGYTFLAWGLLHGVLLAVVYFHRTMRAAFPATWLRLGGSSRLLTFLAVMMTWVLFRADSLSSGGFMYLNLLLPVGSILEQAGLITTVTAQPITHVPAIGKTTVCAAVLALLGCLALPSTAQLFHEYLGGVTKEMPRGRLVRALAWRPSTAWAIATGTAFSFAVADMLAASPSAFLYFQF
jgi:alginate O-acetyltransferase complex protein AlgI